MITVISTALVILFVSLALASHFRRWLEKLEFADLRYLESRRAAREAFERRFTTF